MIDIIDDVIREIRSIESVGDNVYRRWPKKKVAMPAVLVSRMGATPVFTDADGQEVIMTLYYSIDINANVQEDVESITAQVVDKLARYNLHRTGIQDFYDDALKVYRVILTVSGTVDRRGNTFS